MHHEPGGLSSHAIQDVPVGSSASMTRLVSVVRTFAVHFPVFVCMKGAWHHEELRQHKRQHQKRNARH